MPTKELTAFRMASDVMEAMRAVRAKEGIPVSVQMDFAIRTWLRAEKGVKIAAQPPRSPIRKRPRKKA